MQKIESCDQELMQPIPEDSLLAAIKALFDNVTMVIEVDGEILFDALSVAKLVDDSNNYLRRLKTISADEQKMTFTTSLIRHTGIAPMLTEYGMYEYLTKVNTPKAKQFQRTVYENLVKCREQVYTNMVLKNKALELEKEELQKKILVKKKKIEESRSGEFGGFRKAIDTTYVELADYCIRKMFAQCKELRRTKKKFNERTMPEHCIQTCQYWADEYYNRSNEWESLEDKIYDVLVGQRNMDELCDPNNGW